MIVTAFGDTFSLSDPDPIGGPVANAFESALLDEGLQQVKGMVVDGHPIIGDGFDVERQELGRQAFYLHPREHEESGVIGHKM